MLGVEGSQILIAGNYIFRRGVASVIRDVIPGASIAEAFCFADGRARLSGGGFLAAIFDVGATELNGPLSFRTLRADCPHTILSVLSGSANASDILSYLAAGVTGFVLEKSSQTEIERAIREILNGGIYIPPSFIEPTACDREFEPRALRRNDCLLTPRQNGVLRLLLKGYSNKEIARQLNLSPNTVKIHVSALLRCFAVQKRSSLAVAASTLGANEISPHTSWRTVQISA